MCRVMSHAFPFFILSGTKFVTLEAQVRRREGGKMTN